MTTKQLAQWNTVQDLFLPTPCTDYSDSYQNEDLAQEVEQYNSGVWDGLTAARPDIKGIESKDESYRQGFVEGLRHRLVPIEGQLAPLLTA